MQQWAVYSAAKRLATSQGLDLTRIFEWVGILQELGRQDDLTAVQFAAKLVETNEVGSLISGSPSERQAKLMQDAHTVRNLTFDGATNTLRSIQGQFLLIFV